MARTSYRRLLCVKVLLACCCKAGLVHVSMETWRRQERKVVSAAPVSLAEPPGHPQEVMTYSEQADAAVYHHICQGTCKAKTKPRAPAAHERSYGASLQLRSRDRQARERRGASVTGAARSRPSGGRVEAAGSRDFVGARAVGRAEAIAARGVLSQPQRRCDGG